jgi:hypothetical protein
MWLQHETGSVYRNILFEVKSFPQKTRIEELIESKINAGTFHIYLKHYWYFTESQDVAPSVRPHKINSLILITARLYFKSRVKFCYILLYNINVPPDKIFQDS